MSTGAVNNASSSPPAIDRPVPGGVPPNKARLTATKGGGGKVTIQEIGQLIFAEKWSEVTDAVRSDPEAASLQNWAKKTPLHMCCEQGAPLETIRALLHAEPNAASLQDIFGYAPLHVAFVTDDCRGKALELIKACPAALRMGDKQGYLPLHRAVSAKMDLLVLRDLIDACPPSLSVASDRGGVPLDAAGASLVEKLLAVLPEESRSEIGTVLHWACRPRPSASVDISELVRTRPADLKVTNGRGWLPLHVACLWRKYFPDTYLASLLRAYPEGSIVPDVEGNIPLHYACKAGYTERGDVKGEAEAVVFRELIRTAGREGFFHGNATGQIPLHVACHSRSLSPEAFTVILEAYPEALQSEDAEGITPIGSFMLGCCERGIRAHALLADEKVWLMLNMLLRRNFDDEHDRPQDDGTNTLHSCLRVRRCPRDFLWLVASQYPEQITARDTRGRFPLHAAAAHLDGADADATSFLLDLLGHHPAAVKERDDDWKYPLMHMIESGRGWSGGVREAVAAHPQALYDCAIGDALLPNAAARVGSAGKLETLFELIRGKPHKFFNCLQGAGTAEK